jgi:hypothetical protein
MSSFLSGKSAKLTSEICSQQKTEKYYWYSKQCGNINYIGRLLKYMRRRKKIFSTSKVEL